MQFDAHAFLAKHMLYIMKMENLDENENNLLIFMAKCADDFVANHQPSNVLEIHVQV